MKEYNLTFQTMPVLSPLKIKSSTGLLFPNRNWVIIEDWKYSINNEDYIITKGFVFDGASVPICCRCVRSSTGILFIAGLVHDWGYKHGSLARLLDDNTIVNKQMSKKQLDIIFRDTSNDCKISYFLLYLFGFHAWNQHRK